MKKIRLFCLFLFLDLIGLQAQNWDINTLHRVNSWNGIFVRNYSTALSNSTAYVSLGVPVCLMAYAFIDKDNKRLSDAIYIGSSVAGAIIINTGLKSLVNRERPYERYPGRVHASAYESSSSFPSAHTAAAFSLATSLSICYPKWYVIAPSTFWACSVGFSRMNKGVHYPSDVMAGAVIGAGSAVVNIYVNRWLNRWMFGVKQK